MSVERAQLEYWVECLDEMRTQIESLRTAYAEARDGGAGEEELRGLRERGEKLAARVQNGERLIAEEEARLAKAEDEGARS